MAITAYKGMDKNMQCREFQYEVGGTYETDKAICCEEGFHACETPLDVLHYYPPADSRYFEVEQSGEISRKPNDDSKVASSKLTVKAEIGLPGLIKAQIEWVRAHIDKATEQTNTGNYSAATNTGDYSAATNTGDYSATTNTGDYSAATNTGDYSAATNTGNYSAAANTGDYSATTNTGYRSAATNTGNYSAATNTGNRSAATNTGDYSAATNTGDYSAATNTGDYSATTNTGDYSATTNTGDYSAAEVAGKASVAIATGSQSKARGAKGCAIVLVERGDYDGETYPIKAIKAVKIDGKRYKADTWYKLIDGKIVEAE